jgi:hypothetical protein
VVSTKPMPSVSTRVPAAAKIGGIGNTATNATRNWRKGRSR